MGRPRKFTDDQEKVIAEQVRLHGPREAARRWTDTHPPELRLDAATALRIANQRGGSAAPEAQATAVVAEDGLLPAPAAPLDLVASQETVVQRLQVALAGTREPRVIGALAGQHGAAVRTLEQLRAAAKPAEDRRWKVVLYLPAKDDAPD